MNQEQPSFYAVMEADVRYDKNLSFAEKVLYAEITALCDRSGKCFAGNTYFSKLYNRDTRTIQRWITALQKNGYISVEIKGGRRNIRVMDKVSRKSNFESKKDINEEHKNSSELKTPAQKCARENLDTNMTNMSYHRDKNAIENNNNYQSKEKVLHTKKKSAKYEKCKRKELLKFWYGKLSDLFDLNPRLTRNVSDNQILKWCTSPGFDIEQIKIAIKESAFLKESWSLKFYLQNYKEIQAHKYADSYFKNSKKYSAVKNLSMRNYTHEGLEQFPDKWENIEI